MQRANCTVKLGSLGNTVAKTNVSPAEAACLLAIHGEGSVVDVQPTIMDKTPHTQERSRLRTTYGEHVVDRLFPGEFNKLPTKFSEIRFGNEDPEEDEANADDGNEIDPDAMTGAEVISAGAELDEDDKILRDSILVAGSKQAIRDIAKENEIDLTDVADKMDILREKLIERLFAGKAG